MKSNTKKLEILEELYDKIEGSDCKGVLCIDCPFRTNMLEICSMIDHGDE